MINKPWTVIRHSGRGKLPPRIAYRGQEENARVYFNKIRSKLKIGSVLLIDHAGGLQAFEWGPRENV